MSTELRLVLLLAASGCSSSTVSPIGPPTGGSGVRITSPCDAGNAILLSGLKLRCGIAPPSPTRRPSFWGENRPCQVTTHLASGAVPDLVTKFGTGTSTSYPHATFNASGNIASWTPLELGESAPTVTYEYTGEILTGAHLTDAGSTMIREQYVYINDGDRRLREEKVGDPNVKYHYVYEGSRLVAEGPSVNGAPPVRYALDFLQVGADGRLPRVARIPDGNVSGASAPERAYFYEGDRLSVVGLALTPGFPYGRMDYTYQDTKLSSVSLIGTEDFNDPEFQPQTWSYDYQCN
jgi:hypothetical protein